MRVACWTSDMCQWQCSAGARMDSIIISMASATLAKPTIAVSHIYSSRKPNICWVKLLLIFPDYVPHLEFPEPELVDGLPHRVGWGGLPRTSTSIHRHLAHRST